MNKCPICDYLLPVTQELANIHINKCLDSCNSSPNTIIQRASKIRQCSLNSFFSSTTTPPAISLKINYSSEDVIKLRKNIILDKLPSRGNILSHKCIMGTNFVMDCFEIGRIPECFYYFLSHFHSDHYNGLRASFDYGKIVCSSVTGNLVSKVLKVKEEFIIRIPLGVWTPIDGVDIFLIDAHHCPGSAMFIFRLNHPDQKYILHTGDFRGTSELISSPIWQDLNIPSFTAIYLDTTYCDPKYIFPSQDQVIGDCCKLVERLVLKNDTRTFSPIKRVILVGSYLVGKEKVALAIAKLLNCKIYCSNRKRRIFDCLGWSELTDRLVDNGEEAQVHIVSMGDLDPESVGNMLTALWPTFTHALVIKPTGWTFGRETTNKLTFHDHIRLDANLQVMKRKNTICTFALPYSEHSSFGELCDFLKSPWISSFDMLIPTVDNPLDLYLNQRDYESSGELLLTWHHIKLCHSHTSKEGKNYSTRYSRVVSHRSTNLAIACLTSGIGRDRVLSCIYGRS